jgi:deoxyribodipyrimidine photo-lyase
VSLSGGPAEIPALVRRLGASALVADFSPLRPVREALDAVVSDLRHDGLTVYQVTSVQETCSPFHGNST